MDSDKYCLRWNDFDKNISSAFKGIREEQDFFDVTLVCEDEQLQAHKLILASSSLFFKNVLRRNPHQHPLLYLKGVKHLNLVYLLEFMYNGQVNVSQEHLTEFLVVAEDLKVNGLSQSKQGTSRASTSKPTNCPQNLKSASHQDSHSKQQSPAKRSRPFNNIVEEDIEEIPVKSEPREVQPLVSQQHCFRSNALETTADALVGSDDHPTTFQDSDFRYEDENEGYEDHVGDGMETDGNRVEVLIKEESVNSIIPDEELDVVGGVYKCKLCFKTLDCLDTARNHILAHFALPGGLTCLQCGLSFDSKVLFGIHMASEHKNIKKW